MPFKKNKFGNLERLRPAAKILPAGRREAFTIIEMLIVITIVSVLSATVVLDFRGGKRRQEVSVLADQGLAMMQQTHAEVAAGKKRTDTEQNDDGKDIRVTTLLCEGAYFELGAAPLLVKADYDSDLGECDIYGASTEAYGLSTGSASVKGISVGGSELKALWALFEPPNGNVSFDGGDYTGDADIIFGHEGQEDFEVELSISYTTGQAFISVKSDDEE